MVFMDIKSDFISCSDIVQRLPFRGMAIPGLQSESRAQKGCERRRRPTTFLRVNDRVALWLSMTLTHGENPRLEWVVLWLGNRKTPSCYKKAILLAGFRRRRETVHEAAGPVGLPSSGQ